jgi:hypothetical protein
MSHIIHHTSHITHHTSHITHHTSHITHHTSHITHHTSHTTNLTDPIHIPEALCARASNLPAILTRPPIFTLTFASGNTARGTQPRRRADAYPAWTGVAAAGTGTLVRAAAAVGADLSADGVVEIAVALWALQQGTAGAPETFVAHTFGKDAFAFAVAGIGAGVLAGDLEDPPGKD